MPVLDWNDALNVGMDFMDADHADAADQINGMAQADLAGRLGLIDHFIHHCQDHFAREEEMMATTGFFALGCHRDEHQRVLAELDGIKTRLQSGDAQDEYFTKALPAWLINHRGTMDFVTAEFARKQGYHGRS